MNENSDAEKGREGEAETSKVSHFFFSSFFSFPALLIILHVGIALYLAYYLNIWKDEASTLYTTRNGFLDTLKNVSANEKQAPLYFIVLSLWRALGDSIFFARIFSIIWSAAAIKFFYDLAGRFTDEPAAKFLAAFFAIHPFFIWASVETRVYSLVILFSILLLKFFDGGYLDKEKDFSAKVQSSQRRARIYFVLTAIVALYTNYYLGFVLVGGFFALVVLRRFRLARDYFLQMLAVGAAFLPLLWILKQQFAVRVVGFVQEKSLVEAAGILSNRMLNFVFPMELSFDLAPSAFSLIRICFLSATAAAIVYFLVKGGFRAAGEKILAAAAIVAMICAFLLAAYFLLGAEYIVNRHFSVLFAPFFCSRARSRQMFCRKKVGFTLPFCLFFYFLTRKFTNNSRILPNKAIGRASRSLSRRTKSRIRQSSFFLPLTHSRFPFITKAIIALCRTKNFSPGVLKIRRQARAR
ncbi:MAG: glycosyltransferase family 39 protein [Acidobacteriota bacterium]|nr:glycosyltransferase family 39 protein [Acidobacteriota bacterium]